jgi:hypothetical protein
MESPEDRVVRLERLLLAHGVASINYDAVGEPDQATLIAELASLGFVFRGCDLHGYAWEAEFRRPSSHGGRPTMGCATAYSKHVAVQEAAIAALTAEEPAVAGPNQGPPPGAWTTWRRARPAPRLPHVIRPAIST